MKATWVLVCDASRAKMFLAANREEEWTVLEDLRHPAGREYSHELSPSSAPGRTQVTTTAGTRRSAMEPPTTPKEAEAERFAKDLAAKLDAAVAQRHAESFVVVAPPDLLGLLRQSFAHETARHVRTSVGKDLVHFDNAAIRTHLLDVVFPPAG